jgi:hypothetical protein
MNEESPDVRPTALLRVLVVVPAPVMIEVGRQLPADVAAMERDPQARVHAQVR